MRIAAIDRVDISEDRTDLPLTLHQSSAPLPAFALLGISLLAIGCLLMPVGLIAAHAATDPRAMTMIADRAGSTLLLSIGVAILLAVLAVPLQTGLARLHRSAVVKIRDGRVEVAERRITGDYAWEAPIASFQGVAHHIRATLSGPRHEVVLVHTDPSRDVLLALGERQPKHGADVWARTLGLPEVPARSLYGRRRAPVFTGFAPLAAAAT